MEEMYSMDTTYFYKGEFLPFGIWITVEDMEKSSEGEIRAKYNVVSVNKMEVVNRLTKKYIRTLHKSSKEDILSQHKEWVVKNPKKVKRYRNSVITQLGSIGMSTIEAVEFVDSGGKNGRTA